MASDEDASPGRQLLHVVDDTSWTGWIPHVPDCRSCELITERDAGTAPVRETDELGPLLRRVSLALTSVTGCRKTYFAQFAEHPNHSHVHVHVIPQSPDETDLGRRIFSHLGVPDEDRVSDRRMDEIALDVRAALAALP